MSRRSPRLRPISRRGAVGSKRRDMRSAFASSRDFEASEVTFLQQEIRELERVIAEAQASRARASCSRRRRRTLTSSDLLEEAQARAGGRGAGGGGRRRRRRRRRARRRRSSCACSSSSCAASSRGMEAARQAARDAEAYALSVARS